MGKSKQKRSPRDTVKRQSSKKATTRTYLLGFLVIIIAVVSVFIFWNINSSGPDTLAIVYPFDKALFPPEIIAPRIWWRDSNPDADKWQLTIKFADHDPPVSVELDTTTWIPDKKLWETIKQRSLEKKATFTVKSMKTIAGLNKTISRTSISFSTSQDSVAAPIFYRDVPLPFSVALKNVEKIKWRLGNIASHDPPPVVLTNLPVCGNCHSFSADGHTLGMDVDIGNDKGAYVLTDFEERTILSREKLISWSTFVRDKKVPTFGMLPRVSPNGRYVLSGVKDRSVFLPRRDILFSQIFFPVMGILACYDRQTGEIFALNGADDEEFVQANGVWTADGKEVVFARNKAVHLKAKGDPEKGIILNKEESIEVLGGEQYLEKPQESPKTFTFDLYKIPFNDGKGGDPVPIKGASRNGMSNYFPKFSPDGKWLVFTQAHSYMLLQPDSRLYIMPAEGGQPRLMNCNTTRMNSWHSWSPNSKWLVFSSKVFSPNTQLFLTHIDENGNDSPPILLRNFTPLDEDRGANIPEFVNIKPDCRIKILERFLDDYNYFRSGQIYEQFRMYDKAEQEYLKSLRLNPRSLESLYSLGILYAKNEDYEKSREKYLALLRINPQNIKARKDLGLIYYRTKELEKAAQAFEQIVKIAPDNWEAHYNLGCVYLDQKKMTLAMNEFNLVLKNESDRERIIGSYFNLGRLYISSKNYPSAVTMFQKVLELNPGNLDAHHNLGNIYRILKENEMAKREYDSIIKLEPKNVPAHLEFAELCAETGDTMTAIKEFKTVMELEPTNLYSQIYLGRIYTRLKDYENATKEFTTILQRDPKNTYAHINLGKMYMEMGNFDAAISELKKVVELDPRDGIACFLLGQLFDEKKNDLQSAQNYLERGLKINPGFFDGRVRLGNIYLKKGDVARALEQLELAYKINPEAPNLKEKIASLKQRQ